MKRLYFFLFTILLSHGLYGQPLPKGKKIHVDGLYTHPASKTLFPEMLGSLYRDGIYKFDKQANDVAVNYIANGKGSYTKLTISVYPSGKSSGDDHLRTEFLTRLTAAAIVDKTALESSIICCNYKKDGFTVNGVRAAFNEQMGVGSLEIYECGGWFLSIRLTTDVEDMKRIADINKQAVSSIDPVELVKNDPWSTLTDTYLAPAGFSDSVTGRCMQQAAYAEVNWIHDNVDSLEQISGYPGLYLEMYLAGLTSISNYMDHHDNLYISSPNKHYIDQVRMLVKSKYLAEFVMEQHNYIMIVPTGRTFDYDGYNVWKRTHPIDIKSNYKYYVTLYEHKKNS